MNARLKWRIVLLFGVLLAACGSQPSEAVATSAEQPDTDVTIEPSADSDPDSLVASLVSCSDVPRIQHDVPGTLGDRNNPDDILMSILLTYASEQGDSFGGLWFDRSSGGTAVIAVPDDPAPHLEELNSRAPRPSDRRGIVPPLPITDDRPLGERDDFAFTVVQVEFTESELRSAQQRMTRLFNDEGTGARSAGVDTVRNRASVDLFDPTPEGLQRVAEAAAGLPVCVNINITPEPPAGPLQIIPEPGQPLTLPPGLGPVEWELDPAFPAPAPDDTTIHVLATERGCANGREMGDALRGPEVLETETEVVIAFAVVPVVGPTGCPANPSTPVSVSLDAPLGDRTLLDVNELDG